jgi:hypothetical protein
LRPAAVDSLSMAVACVVVAGLAWHKRVFADERTQAKITHIAAFDSRIFVSTVLVTEKSSLCRDLRYQTGPSFRRVEAAS